MKFSSLSISTQNWLLLTLVAIHIQARFNIAKLAWGQDFKPNKDVFFYTYAEWAASNEYSVWYLYPVGQHP